MNSIYEKNLGIISSLDNEMYKALLEIDSQKKKHKLSLLEDGSYDLICNNEALYGHASSFDAAKNILSQSEITDARLVLFIGLGLGYELLRFIRYEAEDCGVEFIIVFERDIEILYWALHIHDFSRLFVKENFKIFTNYSEKEIRIYVREKMISFEFIKTVKTLSFLYNPNTMKKYMSNYMADIKTFNAAISLAYKEIGNDPQDSLVGIKNMFDNLDIILENPGIILLKDKFKGMPGVIVSAGPSLNKNKHLLHEVVGKAVLIAPDTSLKPMLNLGVKPHFVTSLERIANQEKYIDKLSKEELENVYYTASPVIMKSNYDAYQGKKIIVYRQYRHFNWLGIERGSLDIKSSAGNMAFKVAEYLGCDPIILIGQDLSFGEDGFTHAEGVVSGSKQPYYNEEEAFYVRGNVKDLVKTSPKWQYLLQQYEQDIMMCDGICINATEGGAYIQGTQVMTFREAIDQYIEKYYPINEMIVESIKSYHYEDEPVRENLYHKIESAIENFEYLNNICQQGKKIVLDYARAFEKEMNENRMPELSDVSEMLTKVSGLKKKMIDVGDDFKDLVMHVAQSYYITFETEMNGKYKEYESKELAMADIIMCHQSFFTIMEEIVDQVKEILINALSHIR